MARPREFDEVQAMNSAAETFRLKGYEAASLIDLLKAMQLSKSSLYNSFGTKHELFLASLDHHSAKSVEKLTELLHAEGSTREVLFKMITACLDWITSEEGKRGCLLHNSAIEVLPHDELARQHIAHGYDRISEVLVDFFKRGQRKGDIPADKDPSEMADTVLMSIMGLRSMGRVYPDRQRLQMLAEKIVNRVL